jgi:hypothetical protein
MGALVPLVGTLASDLLGKRPSPAVAGPQSLVRAIVLPGLPAPQDNGFGGWTGPDLSMEPAPPSARAAGSLQTGFWLVASLAGAGIGLVLSSPLIHLLLK